MRWGAIAAALAMGVAACGGPGGGKPLQQVAGTIDGFVYLTGPVGGVVVTAYGYDLGSGTQGDEIAHSAPTTPDGAFHLELGIYFGPVLLVARGSEATYTEPATGAVVNWDAAQELRAVWTTWSPSKTLDFAFVRGDNQTGVIVGPWAELAIAYATAKQAGGKTGYSDALQTAYLLFHDHLEVDYWALQPVDLTTGSSRSWEAPVQLGLEYAGLSQLVERMAQDSATGGLSSVQLLRLLGRDAGDGVFDGRAIDGALTLGACKRECDLSGQTLRSDLSDSMALFLGSPSNHSEIMPTAINLFLVRIATRHSDLFPPDAVNTYDVTPPTITVVENTAVDESMLQASVTTAGVASFSGPTSVVDLNGTATATFSRYASHYSAMDAGIPKWHFQVQDDHSDSPNITLQAHLVRSSDQMELVPWFNIPSIDGSGYNREIVVSSALYPDLATLSGAYQLELKATDEKGNASAVATVKWQQTILTPPVRQRQAPACDPCTDSQCPSHYSLQAGQCDSGYDAFAPIAGSGLPGGLLRVGHVYVDNPNPVAVHVLVQATASAVYSRGRKGDNNLLNTFSYTPGCQPAQLANGACFSPPVQGVEDLVTDQPVANIYAGLSTWVDDGLTGPCSGCAPTEREIPANSTMEVWVYSNKFSFLYPYPITRLADPNLPSTAIGGVAEQWVSWCPGGTCQLFFQASWYLTRVAVTPSVTVSLQSRPADTRAPLGAATGTDVSGFAATPSVWKTSAPSEASF